jgi:hypothetical protein
MDDVTTEEAKMPPTRNLPDDDSSTNGDSKPSACPKPTAVATDTTIDSQGCASLLTNSKNEDTSVQDIMRQQNIVEFPTLDDVSPVIEAYEKKSGNWLAIRRSLVGEYCLYICKEHVNCTFQIYIGRRRLNGAYVVKRNNTYHTAQQCESVARDGRQWKKRRAGKLDEMIVRVL